MIKSFTLIICILVTLFSYGQGITFQKNESYTARQFKFIQKLNSNGDSLILESEIEKIRRVDILNDDYLEVFEVNSNKGKIDLQKLPYGNFVIQARLGTHWIVMYLEKKEVVEPEIIANVIETTALLEKKSNETRYKSNEMYWVVYERKSHFSSSKTMGLKSGKEIEDLISKNYLEMRTNIGKNNKLLIYEIYNKSEFMREQYRKREYYKSKDSNFFNVTPLYNSEDEKVQITQS